MKKILNLHQFTHQDSQYDTQQAIQQHNNPDSLHQQQFTPQNELSLQQNSINNSAVTQNIKISDNILQNSQKPSKNQSETEFQIFTKLQQKSFFWWQQQDPKLYKFWLNEFRNDFLVNLNESPQIQLELKKLFYFNKQKMERNLMDFINEMQKKFSNVDSDVLRDFIVKIYVQDSFNENKQNQMKWDEVKKNLRSENINKRSENIRKYDKISNINEKQENMLWDSKQMNQWSENVNKQSDKQCDKQSDKRNRSDKQSENDNKYINVAEIYNENYDNEVNQDMLQRIKQSRIQNMRQQVKQINKQRVRNQKQRNNVNQQDEYVNQQLKEFKSLKTKKGQQFVVNSNDIDDQSVQTVSNAS